MNCDRIEELIPRYLDGDLGEGERRMIDDHLASCAYCRESLETFTALEESLGRLTETVPAWKTAEARLSRSLGLERRRSFAPLVFNAPFIAGLSFIAFGIVLFVNGDAIFPALQFLGSRLAASLGALTQDLSRLLGEAAGLNPTALISIYGLLTISLLWGTRILVLRFGKR